MLQTGLRIIRINEKNKLPIKYNDKNTTSLGAIEIDDEDMNEIIEEVRRRGKFDKEFHIGVVFEWEYDDGSSNNEE